MQFTAENNVLGTHATPVMRFATTPANNAPATHNPVPRLERIRANANAKIAVAVQTGARISGPRMNNLALTMAAKKKTPTTAATNSGERYQDALPTSAKRLTSEAKLEDDARLRILWL